MDERVILCVIRPQGEVTVRLSHTDLVRFFSQFGLVSDVEIFNRKVLIKAFVEFSGHAEAEAAVRACHNQMTTFGKMEIFISNKKSIIKRTKSSAFNIASLGNLTDLQRSPRNLKLAFLSSVTTDSIPGPQQSESQTKELSNSRFQCNVSKSPTYEQKTASHFNEFLHGDSCFNFDSNACVGSGPLLLGDSEGPPLSENKKMRVLMVNRINAKLVTVTHLFNLFGCYGNVNKVLINKENNYALVQFQTHSQALNACERLRNLDFFGLTLKIKISRYPSLNFKTLEKEHNEKLSHLHGQSSLFRFPTGSSQSCEPPSQYLKVTNVPIALNVDQLRDFTGQQHESERLVFMADGNGLTNTVFAEYSSVKKAVETLCWLHGQQVNGNVVSFEFSSAKEAQQ